MGRGSGGRGLYKPPSPEGRDVFGNPQEARRAAAFLLAGLMTAFALLHAYWALGGGWFIGTALNMDVERLPSNLVAITWIFVAGMVLVALTALYRVGLLGSKLPAWLPVTLLWGVTVAMFAGAVFDASIPRFWDRWVFAPIFLLLAILALILAWPEKTTT
jgi:hypothetical protein